MTQASEAELVARCRDGSETAFAELVDRYKNLVYGLISQVASDRAGIDDLAQEVFLKVHRGLPSFRGDAKLSTWIFRIVRNVCIDARTNAQPTASLDERTADGQLKLDPAAVDRAFHHVEIRERLEKAIAHCRPTHAFSSRRTTLAANNIKSSPRYWESRSAP
jgi:RNA polymerase sigma factor (sigma-70 family)